MLTRCFLLSSILKLVLLASASQAFAQPEPGQWVGDLYHVHLFTEPPYSKILIDEHDKIHKKIPNIAKLIDFPVPHRYRNSSSGSHWHNDRLYTIAYGANDKNEDGSLFRRLTFAKWQDDEWHFLGDYKTAIGNLLEVIPCDNERFIVVSRETDLTGNTGPMRSPFARMSILPGKKELRVDSSIDHGQDELRKYMSAPECFKMAWLSAIVMTDKYATLVNRSTGLFWVFSLEKASLVRAGNIFKKVTPEMIAKGGFPNPILRVNPEKGGTILIAAQEEDFFITETGNAHKEINELRDNNPLMSDEDALKLLGRRQKQIVDNSPFIVWYRIYPENGKVEKLFEPPEGGSNLRDGGRNDVWRPMPDGSVKMGWEGIYKEEPSKTNQKTNSNSK